MRNEAGFDGTFDINSIELGKKIKMSLCRAKSMKEFNELRHKQLPNQLLWVEKEAELYYYTQYKELYKLNFERVKP